ncbi:unnamed protein product [Urochloa humidicola]
MELELGLAPPNPHYPPAGGGGGGEFLGVLDGAPARACGKRVFGDAFGRAEKATLPLFVRNSDGGGDDDDGSRDVVDCETSNKRKRLVGWPPVKCLHRRSCGGGGGYVKVKMEGVAIGRKVDVSLHASYEDLLRTLAGMFPPSADTSGAGGVVAEAAAAGTQQQERGRGHQPYVVTYEDGDGDWLLVGDVPWEAFAKSVKRLKILA